MVYYAKIIEENGCFIILFPQFAHINTYGESQEAALANAEEALNGCIESDFDRGFNIPQPEKYAGKEFHEIPLRPHIEIAVALRFIRSNRSQMELAWSLSDLHLTARFLPFFPTAALPKYSRSPATLRFCRLALGKNHQKSPRSLKVRQTPRKLGISYQAYQRLENPRRCNPTVKTLERIASVLDKRVEIAII